MAKLTYMVHSTPGACIDSTLVPPSIKMGINILTYLLVLQVATSYVVADDRSPLYWNMNALDTLNRALDLQEFNTNRAKNVIFFLGDGMGMPTVTAARILKGQLMGNPGEETVLSWETLPRVALSKTYNTNQQVPDSAGTATAFLCGVKSYAGAIGVDGTGERGNCASSLTSSVQSILEDAHEAGKLTGIVTTARLTHATPASSYAHVPERDWENDSDLPQGAKEEGCTDIATHFIDHTYIRVAMGGGRREFTRKSDVDPEYTETMGQRTDERNLVDEWIAAHSGDAAEYVWNQKQFDDVDPDKTEYLLGLFEPSHMQYEAERPLDQAGEPSIAEMTEKAIRMLDNELGYLLIVEGGRIDHGHHSNSAFKSLHDAVALEEAVRTAMDMTNSSETLIVVTADHSHAFAFAGYQERGHDIFGKIEGATLDGLPYTTLGYLNGPGGDTVAASFNSTGNRPNHTGVETNSVEFRNEALVPRLSETHGGEDVPIYAGGPYSHLFTGVHEQNYIAHVIRYAACLGEGRQMCTDPTEAPPCDGGTNLNLTPLLMLMTVTLLLSLLK